MLWVLPPPSLRVTGDFNAMASRPPGHPTQPFSHPTRSPRVYAFTRQTRGGSTSYGSDTGLRGAWGRQHGQDQAWSRPQGASVPWGLQTSPCNLRVLFF